MGCQSALSVLPVDPKSIKFKLTEDGWMEMCKEYNATG